MACEVKSAVSYEEFLKLKHLVESEPISLGETSETAYRGDRGKIAYDHSNIVTGNPHNVTKGDLGLEDYDIFQVTNNRGVNIPTQKDIAINTRMPRDATNNFKHIIPPHNFQYVNEGTVCWDLGDNISLQTEHERLTISGEYKVGKTKGKMYVTVIPGFTTIDEDDVIYNLADFVPSWTSHNDIPSLWIDLKKVRAGKYYTDNVNNYAFYDSHPDDASNPFFMELSGFESFWSEQDSELLLLLSKKKDSNAFEAMGAFFNKYLYERILSI